MLGKVALLIFVLSVLFQQISYFQSPTDCTFSHTCTNLDIKATKSRGLLFNGNRDIFNSPSTRTGSVSYKNRFQPDGCILSKYSSKSIRQCLTTFNTPHVYIGGNGVLHTLTNLTTHRMSSTDVVNSKLPIHLEISNIIQKYDTSSITATSAIKYDMITIGKQTNVVVWFNSESSSTLSSTSFSTLISDILEKENNEFSRLISISTRPMGLISPKINQDNENVLRTHTSEIHRYERLKFNVLTYRLMVLNKVCNNMMEPPPYDATCFLTFQTPSVVQGIVLFLCIVVLLCSQLYHKYLYTIYLRTNGPSSIEFMNTLQDHSVQCIVCLVLLVYLCTNTGLFGIAIKGWNIYIWFVVSFFVCVITVYGIEKVKDSSLLNRQQTAEWRGWMQISFLIYHYLGAGQVPLPLYIWIRMMVASFMFMTGFGHTTYFLIKKNYNFPRIWNVLSRLNFLQILLCLVLGRPWIFYYFTPLATVWFGCIYTTLYLYSSKNNSVPFVLFKIFLLIICIEIIFSDMNGATKQNFIYQYIFMNRFTGSLFELSQDHGHFFQSRMAMDRYSVPAGMIFAVLLQKYRLLNKKSTSPSNTSDEAEGGTSIQTVSAFKQENKYWNVLFVKIKLYSIYIGPCVLFMYGIYSYYAIELYPNNTKYNVIQIHTLFSPLIIFSFIIIRNHPRFLIFQYTSTSLIWVGGCSLELFILQYHLLLSVPNYSSLGPAGTLQLIPHSPILSAVFSTVLLFCFSHMASTSTTTILKKIRIQDVIEKMWSYLGGGSSGGSGGSGGGGGGGSGDVQIDVKNKIQTVPLS